MQLKDHYRTLGVTPRAQPQDIKQAYRKLAHKHHPDKNDSAFAATRFQELHEAYLILSNPEKRRKYDEERWLHGMGDRVNEQRIITPEWIEHEAMKLREHMSRIDTYRMSRTALHDYVQLLLSDEHMAILQEHANDELNTKIVHEILLATTGLKSPYIQHITARLAQLAGNNNELLNNIYKVRDHRLRAEQRTNMLPYIVIAITLLLCIFMYLYGVK